jgi:ABC-type phosphate transport system substrate-binding protein
MKFISISKLLSLMLLSVAAVLSVAQAQETVAVRLAGSDLLPKAWVEFVKNQAAEQGIAVNATMLGTLDAERRVSNRTADFALVAAPRGDEIPENWSRIPLAYQVVVVVVHRSNPVDALSYAELRSIFGTGGRAEQWGAFSNEAGWSARKINPGMLRVEDNLSHEIFSHYMMDGQLFRTTTRFTQNTRTLLNMIADDAGAIAVMPSGSLSGLARQMPISREQGSPAFSPTPDNVMFGDYPLRLPFYLAWDPEHVSDAFGAMVEIMLSDASAEVLANNLLMPLPPTERQSYLLEYN